MTRGFELAPAALALAAGLVAAPVTAQESADAPPRATAAPPAADDWDRPSPAARLNLALTGVAVTGVWYGLALGGSFAFPDALASDDLKIPLAGPWMGIAHTRCRDGDANCTPVMIVIGAILMGIDGVGQAGGLGMALESLFLPTSSREQKAPAKTSLRAVPITNGRNTVGLGLTGAF